MQNLILVSIQASFVIILMLILTKFLANKISFKCRYFIWLIICIRMLIPFTIELPQSPINLTVLESDVAFSTNIQDEYIKYNEFTVTENVNEKSFSNFNIVFYTWLFGASGFFLFHVITLIYFEIKIKKSLIKMETKFKIPVYICDKISSPILIGFFKPKILISQNNYSEKELDIILKHELTHYKRGDMWYKLLLLIVNSVHFFNPFAYIMLRQANSDLEYSCDDLVVKNMSLESKQMYALTILKTMKEGKFK